MLPKDETKSVAAKTKSAPGKGRQGPTKLAATTSSARAAPRKPAAARLSDDLEQRIQRRAYELWENEGRPQGREQAHWQQAEREIAGRGASGQA